MARVVAAMSGGVDSSVAAALAVEAGHEVIGVTLKLLPGRPTGFGCCGSPRDIDDAKRVCEKLGLRHYVMDFDEVFERTVVEPFVEDYLNWRTPNPCVECNRSIKFGALLKLAGAWDARVVATGHYARIVRDPKTGTFRMLAAADKGKDQTYFLHFMTQKELSRVLFPLGDWLKDDARIKARELGLKTADKDESQEICFVPGRDYRGFLKSRAGCSAAFAAGEIKDASGRRLGSHDGLANFTIGQRKGLGVASGRPLYVTGIDGATNTLYVGEDSATLRRRFRAARVSWTVAAPASEMQAAVRIRHRAQAASAALSLVDDGRVEVTFDRPQRAVAPGQTAVFYRDSEVLGGGVIEEVL